VQFGDRGPLLLLLGLAVGVLALIAVANLANLQFARLTAQRAEWTLRAALGAGRRDLMRQPFYEGAIVAAAGGSAGLLIAAVVTPALVALDPVAAKQIGALPVDWRVVLGAVAIAGAIAIVASVVPALRQARRDLAPGLAGSGPRTVGSRFDVRLRRVLVGAEMALSVVLLVAAALLLASLSRSSSRSPGFNPTGVLSAQLRVSDKAYPTTAARAQFVDTIVERLRNVPGVVDASTTLNPFVPGFSLFTMISIEGRPAADGNLYSIQFRRITPGFFHTMGIPLIAGRAFLPSDREDTQLVAIVSQLAARRYWSDEDPIGRRIERGGKLFTVVGVVGDTHELGLASPPAPTLYTAYAQSNPPTFPIALVVRVNGSDPYAASDGIRAAVLSADPSQPIDRLLSVDDYFSNGLGSDRLRGVVLMSFAAIGLLLATVGLYGVTASLVEERTREVGVRLVFGATPRQVWLLVVSEAARMVTWGGGGRRARGARRRLGSAQRGDRPELARRLVSRARHRRARPLRTGGGSDSSAARSEIRSESGAYLGRSVRGAPMRLCAGACARCASLRNVSTLTVVWDQLTVVDRLPRRARHCAHAPAHGRTAHWRAERGSIWRAPAGARQRRGRAIRMR
jgi:predicted permease